MPYSINVIDVDKRQIKDSMSGVCCYCHGPGLDIFEEMQAFPKKITVDFENMIYLCHVNTFMSGLNHSAIWMLDMKDNTMAPKHMSIYQELLWRVYSSKLASVINYPKAILDINP